MILTHHAREVMARREISMNEAWRVVYDPQIREPHGGRVRCVRDGLVAVIVPPDEQRDEPVVITFLLRRGASWTDNDARERARRERGR